ncbi:hypothetical protein HMPREF0294_0392 [Corynebacterium glucuronolyticum ATCC 51867]|nr:hypothetical protein HMPREF0294_0392 [Corynebacterium glucuronolyticum ATCC 51867]
MSSILTGGSTKSPARHWFWLGFHLFLRIHKKLKKAQEVLIIPDR